MKGLDEFKQYIKSYMEDTYKHYLSDEEISACASIIIEKVREKSSEKRVLMSEFEVNKMIEDYVGIVPNKAKSDGFELANSFDWVEDATRNSVIDTKSDVYIAASTSDSKKHVREAYRIHFRNEKYKNFESHIKFAIREDRLYFASSSKEAGGYRLYGFDNPAKKSVFCSIKKTGRSSILQKFLGSYDLQYDKYTGYYFIQVEHSEG